MRTFKKRSLIAMIGVAILTAAATTAGSETSMAASAKGTDALRTTMRKLWSDHVIWTRTYIIAATTDDPSAPTQLQRLLKNQEDIGNAVAQFYGSAAGAKLTELLKQHITIAGELVAAAKAGNAAKQADADKRWHANAEDIAEFLAKANPNWTKASLQDMLNRHLALTTREATDRLKKNWTDDVAAFDAVYAEILMMSDALTDGIAKQFPAKVAAM